MQLATYASLLRRCGVSRAFDEGKQLHKHIVTNNFLANNVYIQNLIVQMYGKCGNPADARAVFDNIGNRNLFSWSLMMGAYAENGQSTESLELFWKMRDEGLMPDRVAFLVILGACSFIGVLENGKRVHRDILASGLNMDVGIKSCLVNMYGKCGSVDDAKMVFDGMQKRNVFSWTAMVTAYAQNGHSVEALKLFHKMDLEAVAPNNVTFVSALEACSTLGDLAEGRKIHARIMLSKYWDVTLGNSLLNMYSKCDSIDDAKNVFSSMPHRNDITWNSMVAAYARSGKHGEALELYQQMEPEGAKPNPATFTCIIYACSALGAVEVGKQIHKRIVADGCESEIVLVNALLSMYAKASCLCDARELFERRSEKDEASWNIMISAYAQSGHGHEALDIYQKMDLPPSSYTFTSVLHACSAARALEEGKNTHADLLARGFEADGAVGNALLTMYGKCNCLDRARKVFDEMNERDVVTWTAMITAYVQNGYPKEALQVYHMMNIASNVKPNDVTFMGALDACSMLGGLGEGRLIHTRIMEEGTFSLDNSVGNALMNMYGNCGSLEDATNVFLKMNKREIVCWSTLVTAYAQHGQVKKALEFVYDMCLEGVLPDDTTFTSVLFACSHMGLLDKGQEIFKFMTCDCGMTAGSIHYKCVVDLLSRAGWLSEAEELINTMAYEPDDCAWMALLSSCKLYGDLDGGTRAALQLELPSKPAAFVVLSSIFKGNVERQMWNGPRSVT